MLKETTFNDIKRCIQLHDLKILSNDNIENLTFLVDLYAEYLYDDIDNYISSTIKNTTN